MNKENVFKKFNCPKLTDKILCLTHTDLDGSGAAILLQSIFNNVTVQHCSNKTMSYNIKNAVCNPEVSKLYDYIIACDISCTDDDAVKIQINPNHKKLILLDHHITAKNLNKYSWACVCDELLTDSYRTSMYPNNTGMSSGTSLMYDYLDYNNLLNDLNQQIVKEFVFLATAWDTWDWVNIFNSDPKYKKLNTLFGIYDCNMFETKFINKFKDKSFNCIFDNVDELLLTLESNKIQEYLTNIKNAIKTGNLNIHDTYYSCVFCTSSNYLSDTFEFMETEYPDYDLYFVCYFTGVSIRTTNPNINIGNIVADLGGGGHMGAGGFKIPFELQKEYMSTAFHSNLFVDEMERKDN